MKRRTQFFFLTLPQMLVSLPLPFSFFPCACLHTAGSQLSVPEWQHVLLLSELNIYYTAHSDFNYISAGKCLHGRSNGLDPGVVPAALVRTHTDPDPCHSGEVMEGRKGALIDLQTRNNTAQLLRMNILIMVRCKLIGCTQCKYMNILANGCSNTKILSQAVKLKGVSYVSVFCRGKCVWLSLADRVI